MSCTRLWDGSLYRIYWCPRIGVDEVREVEHLGKIILISFIHEFPEYKIWMNYQSVGHRVFFLVNAFHLCIRHVSSPG